MAMNTANGEGGLCYSWQPAKFANMIFCKYHYIHYYHFIKWIHQNDGRYMGRGDFAIPVVRPNPVVQIHKNYSYIKRCFIEWSQSLIYNRAFLQHFCAFLRIFANDFWWPRDASLSVGQVWYIIDMTFFQNIFAYFCKWFLVTKCLSAPEDCAQMQNPKCNSDTTLLSVFCHSFEIRIYHFIIVIDTHLMINHDSDFQK